MWRSTMSGSICFFWIWGTTVLLGGASDLRASRPDKSTPVLQRFFDGAAERGRVEGGIAIELRLDLAEEIKCPARLDPAAGDQLAHVLEVSGVAAFDLGQRLRVKVVVMERELPLLRDERAAPLPARKLRDEIGGTGEFDVELQGFLEPGDRPEKRVTLGIDPEVHVDRARAPAEQDRRHSSGEVDARRVPGLRAQRAHEGANPLGVGYLAHSAARSKLTSLRISALYFECAA